MIIYTARGFGKSGGLIHLDNPAYEGADARKIIDLAATRPEVIKDGDDPVIGFAGASYGGAISLLAGALDPRVDAIVPAFTWNSLSQSLFPQHRVGAGAAVAGRRHTDRPARSLQAALGFAAVPQCRTAAGGRQRQPGLRALRPRVLHGLPAGRRDGPTRSRR